MTEIKQRFQCKQCQLIWETIVHPYIPKHKEIVMVFKECPHCKSDNFVSKVVTSPKNPLGKI